MLIIALVGCSNQESSPTPSLSPVVSDSASTEAPASQDENSQYPIVIKHAFGETVIESKPERVATIQWANH
ncbi:hypothetical protein, partial [Acinetobacter sp. AGC35]